MSIWDVIDSGAPQPNPSDTSQVIPPAPEITYDQAKQAVDDQTYRMKMTGAGMLGETLASLPALAGIIGATGKAIGQTAVQAVTDEDMAPVQNFNDALQESALIELSADAMQLGYDAFHMDKDVRAMPGEPGYITAEEEWMGTMGAAAMPLPTLGKIKAVAQGAPWLVRKGLTALEVTLPGFHGGITKPGAVNLAQNAATAGAVTDVGRAVMGEETFLGQMLESKPLPQDDQDSAMQAGAVASDIPVLAVDEDMPRTVWDIIDAKETGGDDTNASIWDVIDAGDPEAGSGDATAAKAIGAGVGVTLGIAGLASIARGRGVPKVIRELETAVSDQNKPIYDAVKREVGQDAANAMAASLQKHTYTASDNIRQQAHAFGVLDTENDIRAAIPLDQLERVWRAAPEEIRQKVDTALRDADILQQLEYVNLTDEQIAKYKPAINAKRGFVKAMERDEQVGPMMKMYQRLMQDYSAFRHARGIIGDEQYAKESRPNHYYMPTQYLTREGIREQSIVSRKISEALSNSAARQSKRWLSPFEKQKTLGAEDAPAKATDETLNRILYAEREDAMTVARTYSDTTIRHTYENQARLDFIDMMNGSDAVKRVADSNETAGNTIKVIRNGEIETYSIKHDGIYNALRFRPHFVIPIMNFSRKWVQRGATGNLNPSFAGTSLIYDTTMGVLAGSTKTGNTGLVDSLLDTAMKRAGWSDQSNKTVRNLLAGATRIPDAGLAVIEGLARGAAGRLKEMQVISLSRRLGVDPSNVQLQSALRESVDKFYDTAYGQMVSQGYTSSRFEADPYNPRAAFRAIDDLSRRFTNHPAYRAYDGLFSTIRDAYRVGIFARTAAAKKWQLGRKLTDKELAQVSSHTKNIAVDTTKAGSAPLASGANSMIPYGNVTTQTTVHLIRSLGDPATASVLTAVMGIAAWAREDIRDALGDSALAEWYMRTPSYDQIASFPMRLGNEIVDVPLGIEMGALFYALNDAFRTFFDDKSSGENLLPGATFKDSISRLLNISTPPLADATYAIIKGSRVRLGDLLMNTNAMATPLKNQAQGGQSEQRGYGGNSGLMPDRAAQTLQALLGTFGMHVADAIETTVDQTMRTDYDAGWFKAVGDMWGHAIKQSPKTAAQLAENVFVEETQKRYPVIWNRTIGGAVVKDGRFTPLSNAVYNMDKSLESFKELYMQHRNGGVGRGGSNPYPIGPDMLDDMSAIPIMLREDDPLRAQMQDVAMYFDQTQRAQQRKNINQMKRVMESYTANLTLTKNERAVRQNSLNNRIQDEYELLMRDFGAFETTMKSRYGEDWTLNKLADDITWRLSNVRINSR